MLRNTFCGIALLALQGSAAPVTVVCPESAVAQNGLPCPGNTEDISLPSLNPAEPNKTGVRILPIPGTPIDPYGCAPNAEGKPELLGQDMITPYKNLYVRSHGTIPPRAIARDMKGWKLQIDGEVHADTRSPPNNNCRAVSLACNARSRRSVLSRWRS
jgi:hypothetical protein